jgi:hypothetical protein
MAARTIYTFDITNTRKRYYMVSAQILLLINFLYFALVQYQQFASGQCNSVFRCLVMPAVFLLIVVFRFIWALRHKKVMLTSLHLSVIGSLLWVMQKEYGLAALVLALGLFEFAVNRDTLCTIDEKGVRLHTFPPRVYAWSEINQVILKDGIFTIDRKNNKIFQLDISEEQLSFTEEELNAFCARWVQ